MIGALLVQGIPAVAGLFVAAVLSWIGFNTHRTASDPKTPLAESVLLELGLGLVAVTALVLFSASLALSFSPKERVLPGPVL
jgi:hypothetical protein